MKKGKKIWNRLLSLVLSLVMVTGMFAGMGMEAKAAIIPGSNEQANNGGSIGYDHIWVLTPGNTGTEFYNRVEDIPLTGYAEIKDLTYITTSRSGQEESKGFFGKMVVQMSKLRMEYIGSINIMTVIMVGLQRE